MYITLKTHEFAYHNGTLLPFSVGFWFLKFISFIRAHLCRGGGGSEREREMLCPKFQICSFWCSIAEVIFSTTQWPTHTKWFCICQPQAGRNRYIPYSGKAHLNDISSSGAGIKLFSLRHFLCQERPAKSYLNSFQISIACSFSPALNADVSKYG